MLKIRREQYALLNLTVANQDPSLFADHAREHHSEAFAGMDEKTVTERLQAILAAAATYGITANRDLLTFVDLAVTFGADWSKPELQWMDAALRNEAAGDIATRLRRLRLEAIYRLEARAAAR